MSTYTHMCLQHNVSNTGNEEDDDDDIFQIVYILVLLKKVEIGIICMYCE